MHTGPPRSGPFQAKCIAVFGLFLSNVIGVGQAPFSSLPGSTSSQSVSRTIHGRVVNALTGTSIARVLININSRQALTDSEGRFEFPQFTDQQGYITATKPGYSQTADYGMPAQQRITDLAAAIEVKLYPDGLVTGIVTGSDGQPLAQQQVMLRRANYDVSGVRWVNSGFSMTNSHGEYRFLVPAGRYRVGIGYNPRTRESGEAVLPLIFPDENASSRLRYFELAAAEEKHIDLRPRMGVAYPVLIRIDQTDSRQNARFTCVTETGEMMNVGFASGSSPGEYRIDLPTGSYLLKAQINTRDETLDGQMRVIVAGHAVSGLAMHLTEAASLPIEVSIDPASSPQGASVHGALQLANTNLQLPGVQQFNLFLHNLGETSDGFNQDIPARAREDKLYEFRAPPGRYRLTGNAGGNWYVESATYGGVTDLLTSDIVIGPGSAGAPIRVVANNQRGSLHGRVDLDTTRTSAWVYLLPKKPVLAPPNPLLVLADGSFYISVPAGSYSAVAFDHRLQEDLRDPEVLAKLTAGARTVEVAVDAESTIELEVSQTKESTK